MRDHEYAPDDFQHPFWAGAGRVHDWKNYIPIRLVNMWDTFTDEQKAAIAENAQNQANDEDWD